MGHAFYHASRYTIGTSIRAAWRVRYEGRENVPRTGGAVVASNHVSYLDHYIMPAGISRPVYFISKAQHFDVPIQRWFFEKWGVIPLRRGEGDNEAFTRSLEVLGKGELLGIYPEGTRSLDGRLHKGHTGAVRLAITAGVPIVPVGMVGTFEALPKGRRMPRFNRVTVRFGPPIDVSAHAGRGDDRTLLRKLTDELMQAIGALSGQQYVDAYQSNPEYRPKTAGDGG